VVAAAPGSPGTVTTVADGSPGSAGATVVDDPDPAASTPGSSSAPSSSWVAAAMAPTTSVAPHRPPMTRCSFGVGSTGGAYVVAESLRHLSNPPDEFTRLMERRCRRLADSR
jgi:hypothetical protein